MAAQRLKSILHRLHRPALHRCSVVDADGVQLHRDVMQLAMQSGPCPAASALACFADLRLAYQRATHA